MPVAFYAKKHRDETSQLDQQKRALHALDRLSFGPRPGDVQQLAAGNIEKWIELQMHPDKIDDSAMQARLAEYRTLQMSSHDLVLQFPPNPVARAAQDGKLPVPRDPYLHAVYMAAIDRLQEKKEKKQDPSGPQSVAVSTTASDTAQPQVVSAAQAQRQLDRQDARRILDNLSQFPPDARMQRILSLPIDEQRTLTQANMPYVKRGALFAGLSPRQREIWCWRSTIRKL